MLYCDMFHLNPWSYGTPAALGACDFFDENANTTRVAANGMILYIAPGIGSEARIVIPEYAAAIVLRNPKNNATKKILRGLHCPNIRTAKAKKPYPATDALKFVEVGITKMIPPRPARPPDIITPAYLIFLTLIPTESAACGCSPHALNLSPNLVL